MVNAWLASVERVEAQRLDFIEHGRKVLDRVLCSEIQGYIKENNLSMAKPQAEALERAF